MTLGKNEKFSELDNLRFGRDKRLNTGVYTEEETSLKLIIDTRSKLEQTFLGMGEL
jgi:hypothetical protein